MDRVPTSDPQPAAWLSPQSLELPLLFLRIFSQFGTLPLSSMIEALRVSSQDSPCITPKSMTILWTYLEFESWDRLHNGCFSSFCTHPTENLSDMASSTSRRSSKRVRFEERWDRQVHCAKLHFLNCFRNHLHDLFLLLVQRWTALGHQTRNGVVWVDPFSLIIIMAKT